jgi:TolB-like protein
MLKRFGLYIVISCLILFIVQASDEQKEESKRQLDLLQEKTLDTVGVLQFVNLSNSSEYAWLGDGIAESLSCDLKSANYIVVERLALKKIVKEIEFSLSDLADETTAPKVGNLAGAKYLITGSYQILGKEIRIVSKLVQTETSLVQCSIKKTGKLDGIFEIQDDLILDLIGKLKTIFKVENITRDNYDVEEEIRKKPTQSIAAYEAYLKGLENNFLAADKDSPKYREYYDISIKSLLQAIKLDPRMTEALYLLAVDYNNINDKNSFRTYMKKALDSINKDTNQITKLWLYAYNEMHVHKNFKKAVEFYKNILSINSSEIISLWQLFIIYRGARGSDVYDLKESNAYGNKLLQYHPQSTLAGYVREFSKYDRVY